MAFHASFPAASNWKQSVFRPLPLAETYTISSANLAGRFPFIRLTNCSTRKAAVLKNCSRQQHDDPLRPVVNLPPDVFLDYFASMPINDSKFKSYCMEIDLLKEKVKHMFLSSSRDPMEKIQFIYLLWRLGVSYHFEADIEEQLNEIFHAHPHLLTANHYDLYTTATAFHVFRRYGFRTSSDVFNRFKDHNTGKFKKSLLEDMKGILSLYEASFLSFHGENILDEALTFTKAHLKRLVTNDDDGHTSILEPHIRNQIIDALRLPLHRGTQRLKARRYIIFYENEENQDETLLKFAKMDYNRVQLIHQQELHDLQKWWNGMHTAMELPFGRSRLMVFYFWYMAMHFEPRHAFSRSFTVKISVIFFHMDDIYDTYATQEERRLLMEAFERWDHDTVLEGLPVCLQRFYRTFLDVFREYENDLPEGKSFRAHYAREEFKRIVRSYHVESTWLDDPEGYMPSLEEYFSAAQITVGIYQLLSMVLMVENGDVKEFQWLLSNPKSLMAARRICRLEDDLSDHDKEKVHVPSFVHCYMKEHGVSEEEAFVGLSKMVEDAWKDLNEGVMRSNEVSRRLLSWIVDMVRGGEDTWVNYLDRCNYPEHLKDILTELYIQDIP